MNVFYGDKEGELYFRVPTQEDLEKIQEHRNSRRIHKNLTSMLPVYNQAEWYNSLGQNNQYFLVSNGAHDVGLIRITDIDWVNRSACVGLDIFYGSQGKGYGKKAFSLLVDYCFEELRLHRLWLLVADFNAKAIHIYQDAGFRHEGVQKDALFRDGLYHNYLMMSKLEDDR